MNRTEEFPPLNFPQAQLNIRKTTGELEVFDRSRKRYVRLTPEEWVRQYCIEFLVNDCHIPRNLLQVEAAFKLGKLTKRFDVLVYSAQHKPLLLVECKQSSVEITQQVFEQVAHYNQMLRAPYLFITNGLQHYCLFMQNENEGYSFLENIPHWENLNILEHP